MAFPLRISTGAPGIYQTPDSPLHLLTGVRMDVAAFVGVAPRGPVRVPLFSEWWRDDGPCVEPQRPRRRTVAYPVESFDEYRRLFGGFEGPGLLPFAVATFFEQGGRRAYIARVVHDYGNAVDRETFQLLNEAGVAAGIVAKDATDTPLKLCARNEGAWGNTLRASLDFDCQPLEFRSAQLTWLITDSFVEVPAGTLLRLTLADSSRFLVLVAAASVELQPHSAGSFNRAIFDRPLPSPIESAEIVEGLLTIDDGDGRTEIHRGLGFSAMHPRWMATVLCYESDLVYPDSSWIGGQVVPTNAELAASGWSDSFRGPDLQPVKDRYADIVPEDLFDDWTLGDEEPGDGIFALTQLSDLSLVVVPDLYSPAPLSGAASVVDPASLAGPDFELCVRQEHKTEQANGEFDLDGLRLDPLLPADREAIIGYQRRLEDLADQLRSFIVLLDVPPGLNQRQILSWRARFNSAFAAAYYPWLQIVSAGNKLAGDSATRKRSLEEISVRDAPKQFDPAHSVNRFRQDKVLRHIPPAAVAAGIIARQELAFGVPTGPANVLAAEVVGVDDAVSPARHDELHPQGINVYLRERDGVRLTAARTLSRDSAFRQLSVRRLITMIARALEQQMQWAVFEPNNAALRAELRLALTNYLRQLFNAGAFRGANEEEAFFVRCDELNNPSYLSDTGRLVAEIGVAPAEPLEFIVLQFTRGGDGTLTLQEK